MPKQKVTISQTTGAGQIAKAPNWTILPNAPVTDIRCDYRCNCEIDVNGIGRVQVKPGYSVNISDIDYTYG